MNEDNINELIIDNSTSKGMIKNQKSTRMNKGAITILVMFFILPGLYCIYLGFNDLYNSKIKTKNYILTEATLTSYEQHYDLEDGYSYSSTYTYVVDNIDYKIKSKLIQNSKPEIGSVIEVKYNPINFTDAVIVYDSSTPFILFFGFFFVCISSIIILSTILETKKRAFNILIGLLLVAIGFGGIIVQGFSNHNPFSVITLIKNSGLWIIIPLAFLIIGFYQTIWALFATPEDIEKAFNNANKTKNAGLINNQPKNFKITNKFNCLKVMAKWLYIIFTLLSFLFIFIICLWGLSSSDTTTLGFFIPFTILIFITFIYEILKNLIILNAIKNIEVKLKLEYILHLMQQFSGAIILYFWAIVVFTFFFNSANKTTQNTFIIISLILFLLGTLLIRKKLRK